MIQKNKLTLIVSIGIFTLALAVIIISALQFASSNSSASSIQGGAVTNIVENNQKVEEQKKLSRDIDADIDVIPKGIPEIYGKELSVSYDDVSVNDQNKANQLLKKLGALDTQLKLSGKEKERYIAVGTKISCEYCCGVDAIIFTNGEPACGCAHSFAMRGVAKYLIKYHGSEFTDDEILEELGKWKTLFFPSRLASKAQVLKEKGIELNYINLASNKYRGIENKQ